MGYTPDTSEINARLILRKEKAKGEARALLAFERSSKDIRDGRARKALVEGRFVSGDGPSAAPRIRLDEFLCGVGKGQLSRRAVLFIFVVSGQSRRARCLCPLFQ